MEHDHVEPTAPDRRAAIVAVDEEQAVLDALVVDLDGRFGRDFHVVGSASAEHAEEVLADLQAADRAVALVLVADALPGRASAEVLATAKQRHPGAKRALLVDRDYSSESPVVRAMTLGQADYHLTRPWTASETLFRAVSGFLADWSDARQSTLEMFRIVSGPDQAPIGAIRDLLGRIGISSGVYGADSEEGRRILTAAGHDGSRLPVLVRHDGHVLVQPEIREVIRAVGVNVDNDVDQCDLAIVGAGPAGLTAAVYAASEGLDTVLLDRFVSGGQAGSSPMIRNYPGFPHGVRGGDLTQRACEQAWLFGAHIIFAQEVVGLDREGDWRLVRLADGSAVRARSVVIATGVKWRRLGVPELEALVGEGVFYGAAASEAGAMAGQHVVVVGGGNSAGQAALHLARHAASVTMLVRGPTLGRSMSSYLVQEIDATTNVIVRTDTEAVGGGGPDRLHHVSVRHRPTGAVEALPAAGLFVLIGGEPRTQWLPPELVRDEYGYLVTGRDLAEVACPLHTVPPLSLETSIPGVFAVGDIRHGSLKRVASAVGDGAGVVRMAHEYLGDGEDRPSTPAPLEALAG